MAASPRLEGLRALRSAADNSPRLAQLRALKHLLPAGPAPVVQAVRFGEAENLTKPDVEPSVLPAPLAKAVSELYAGKTEALKAEIDKPEAATSWLIDTYGLAAAPARIWTEVKARDWETLGAKKLQALEAESMSLGFFQQQNVLMDELKQTYAQDVEDNPGRPIRVASFQFERANEDAPLTTKIVPKKIEKAITEYITDSPLMGIQDTGDLQKKVQENLNQTLFSSGQYQWIAKNWNAIADTHNVVVDVDFYPDRMASAAGLHKDSVGETLFVNLTYANLQKGVAPEHVIDNETQDALQSEMPDVAKELVTTVRDDNRDDEGHIHGTDLPERGRVSFIDPTVWHSTPLYGRRAKQLDYPDEAIVTLGQVRLDLEKSRTKSGRGLELLEAFEATYTVPPDLAQSWGYVDTKDTFTIGQWRQAASERDEPEKSDLRVHINKALAPIEVSGKEIKTALEDKTFAFGGIVRKKGQDDREEVDVPMEPARRRQRARSIALKESPAKIDALQEASGKKRSFIRSWVMIIKK